MLQLSEVTLVCMDTVNSHKAVRALEYSCRGIEFGKVLLISDHMPQDIPDTIDWRYTSKCQTIDEWSFRAIYNLPYYIETSHCLLIHSDGFVINAQSWNPEWLQYDYIGSPWPIPTDDFSYRDINGVIQRVGNSVSLRSKKLLQVAIDQNLSWQPFHGYWNEDGFICVNNRHIYEEAGCKFAPFEVALYFGRECPLPENENIEPFCFHKWQGKNNIYPRF